MTERRVRLTATAALHVERERTWWLANRDHQDLFTAEIESALRLVALMPRAGTPYDSADTPGLRRLYLRKLACHVYYTFDDQEVLVRAFWGARRERGPRV